MGIGSLLLPADHPQLDPSQAQPVDRAVPLGSLLLLELAAPGLLSRVFRLPQLALVEMP